MCASEWTVSWSVAISKPLSAETSACIKLCFFTTHEYEPSHQNDSQGFSLYPDLLWWQFLPCPTVTWIVNTGITLNLCSPPVNLQRNTLVKVRGSAWLQPWLLGPSPTLHHLDFGVWECLCESVGATCRFVYRYLGTGRWLKLCFNKGWSTGIQSSKSLFLLVLLFDAPSVLVPINVIKTRTVQIFFFLPLEDSNSTECQ